MMLFATLMMCGFLWSQEVFTVVYATSDDGFVNVRQRPSAKSKKSHKFGCYLMVWGKAFGEDNKEIGLK